MLANRRRAHTMENMSAYAHLGMSILTVLFFVGLAGSCLVILISFVEDVMELSGKE